MKKSKLMNLVLAGTIVTSVVAYTSTLVEATTSTGVDMQLKQHQITKKL